MLNLNDQTRKFILSEGDIKKPGIYAYIQSIQELVDSVKPTSMRDQRRLQMMKENLKEIKRHARKMHERITILEEQVEVLEESK